MPTQRSWRKVLNGFVKALRIQSREETAELGEVGTELHLWDSQRRIINEIAAGMDDGIRTFYVLKSRQLGSTTIMVIILLFWLALHPRTKGALVVDRPETRDDFRETIRNIILSIPTRYFGGAFGIRHKANNRTFMGFTNGSQLNFLVAGTSTRNENWGESKGYSVVVLSETAKYGSEQGLLNFLEALSNDNPDRLYIFESTANGPNHWERMWKEAIDDPFSIRRIFVGWWSKELNQIKKTDPKFHMFGLAPPDERERERAKIVKEKYGHDITVEQLAWFRWRLSQPGQTERALLQNQPWFDTEAFVLSGKSFFHIRTIAQNYEWLDQTGMGFYEGYRFWLGNDFWSTKVEHITEQLRQKEIEFRVWEQPVPDGRYVIGCDPAGGSDDKNDRHVVSVWRCYGDKLDQVAEYADNIADTRQCAWVLAYVAGIYKNCLVNIELSGGYGNTVLVEFEHLRELLRASQNAGRLFLSGAESNEFLDAIRWFIYRRPDNPSAAGYTINTKTSGDIKREILNGFRDSHVMNELIIRSKGLLAEMQIVVQEQSSIGASGNQKDDRVMAACFARDAWVKHERSGLLMAGETYQAVKDRESGDHPGRDMINNIVKQYFLQIQDGVVEEPRTPARAWLEERGLV